MGIKNVPERKGLRRAFGRIDLKQDVRTTGERLEEGVGHPQVALGIDQQRMGFVSPIGNPTHSGYIDRAMAADRDTWGRAKTDRQQSGTEDRPPEPAKGIPSYTPMIALAMILLAFAGRRSLAEKRTRRITKWWSMDTVSARGVVDLVHGMSLPIEVCDVAPPLTSDPSARDASTTAVDTVVMAQSPTRWSASHADRPGGAGTQWLGQHVQWLTPISGLNLDVGRLVEAAYGSDHMMSASAGCNSGGCNSAGCDGSPSRRRSKDAFEEGIGPRSVPASDTVGEPQDIDVFTPTEVESDPTVAVDAADGTTAPPEDLVTEDAVTEDGVADAMTSNDIVSAQCYLDVNPNGGCGQNGKVVTYFKDEDKDKEGNKDSQWKVCNYQACPVPAGYADNAFDCLDDPKKGGEAFNSQTVWYADSDADGFGIDGSGNKKQCQQPDDYVADATDCNDNAATVYPGHPEVCGDTLDNDCDGVTDRGPGVICLSSAEAKFLGQSQQGSGDRAGTQVVIGDFNGDMAMDLGIVAPGAGYDGKGKDTGYVFVVRGPLDLSQPPVVDLYDVLLSGGALFVGEESDDQLSTVALGRGDQDASTKILLGGASPNVNASAGKAFYLHAGPQVQGVLDLKKPNTYLAKFTGTPSSLPASPQKGSHAGVAMAIGDLDANGRADLLIMAPGIGGGAFHLILDHDTDSPDDPIIAGGSLDDLAKANKILKLSGEGLSEAFGATVAVVNPLAGNPLFNTKPTVVVGDPEYVENGNTLGAVYLLWGDEFPFDKIGEHKIKDLQNSSYPFTLIKGVKGGGGLGGATAVPVGGALLCPAMYASTAYLIQAPFTNSASFSVTDKVIATFSGDDAETAGRYAASGDINCDGYPDVLIGAEGAAFGKAVAVGGVYLFLGSQGGYAKDYALNQAALHLEGELFGTVGGGASQVAVGHLDEDNIPDIVVGAPAAENSAGKVYVLSGKSLQKYLAGSLCQ